MTLLSWATQQFRPRRPGEGMLLSDRLVVALILLSVLSAALQTEASLQAEYAWAFFSFDIICGSIFTLEYLARVWAAGVDPRYRGVRGRLRYLLSPLALLDLLALLPFLFLLATSQGSILRLARLLRILSLARLLRFSEALHLCFEAVRSRSYELLVSLGLALIVLCASSVGLYFAERAAQPEAFGSIPRALWASIITLTTVGYGDIYPVTPLGRAVAGLTAFFAVALVALPAGILAASFSDAIQRKAEGDAGKET